MPLKRYLIRFLRTRLPMASGRSLAPITATDDGSKIGVTSSPKGCLGGRGILLPYALAAG